MAASPRGAAACGALAGGGPPCPAGAAPEAACAFAAACGEARPRVSIVEAGLDVDAEYELGGEHFGDDIDCAQFYILYELGRGLRRARGQLARRGPYWRAPARGFSALPK